MDFPTGVWARVVKPPSQEPELLAVRIERAHGGGFLILTRAPDGDFDTWVESREDVMDYLSSMSVDWAASERDG